MTPLCSDGGPVHLEAGGVKLLQLRLQALIFPNPFVMNAARGQSFHNSKEQPVSLDTVDN